MPIDHGPAREDPALALECLYFRRDAFPRLIGGSDLVLDNVWKRADRVAAARRGRFAAGAVVDAIHLLRIADTAELEPAAGALFVQRGPLRQSADGQAAFLRLNTDITIESAIRPNDLGDKVLYPPGALFDDERSLVVGRRTGASTFDLLAVGRRVRSDRFGEVDKPGRQNAP